jgi:acetyl-CoA carboxylase biotin carboxyl carrier protein
MSLSSRDVDEIVRLLDQSAFDTLDLEIGDLKLKLRRSGAPLERAPKPAPAPAPTVAPKAPTDPSLADVPSPLLGTFYRAPKPGADPFVQPGQQVEEETIIGIIEVMKLMNTVRAGMRGKLVEIVAQNAALVEYGETLIRVRPA